MKTRRKPNHFACVLDDLLDGILLLDENWRITYSNRAARRLSRLTPADAGKTLWELFPQLLGTHLESAYRDAARLREKRTVDGFYYAPFQAWFNIRIVPLKSGLAVHYNDVTAMREAELSRDAAAEQLRQVLDSTTDAVVSLDRGYRFTFMNRMARELLAVSGDLMGKVLWEAYPASVYEGSPFVDHYRRAMDEGIAGEFETYYPEPLNYWLQIIVRPAKDGIIIFFRNITARRLQQDAVRSSEERYRILTELNPEALWSADANGLVLYANQRFLQYLGKDTDLRTGVEYLECFDQEDRERVASVWTHCVATGEEYAIDARLIRASDGSSRWWHVRALPIRGVDGSIEQWLGVANDIHESRIAGDTFARQYAEIDRQRQELEVIYRTAPIGMTLYDPTELRVLRVNTRQAAILGMPPEEVRGKRIEELAPSLPAVHALLRQAANGEEIHNRQIEGELPARPGERRHWELNYSPIFAEDGSVQAIAGATIELTQQKRAEAALVQSEKLAAVGRLASSIAHEINNPLESVTNLIYLARASSVKPDVMDYLDTADQELRRVSIIANQTLRFHRQTSGAHDISCGDLFSTVLSIYEGKLKNANIAISKRKRATKTIVCLEGEIRQVLNNLVGNAIDAMALGGRLLVRSREGTDWRTGRPGLVLTVADTGEGMDATTRARIFEAFFTTKGIAGTGLGLWISSEIVARHEGRLTVRSSRHPSYHGTVAALFLPFQSSVGRAANS